MKKKVAIIITAAGSSSRMGGGIPKQYRLVHGKPVLLRSCEIFCFLRGLTRIIIAAPPGDEEKVRDMLEGAKGGFPAPYTVVPGGKSRTESVFAALSKVPADSDFVLVHDAARPFAPRSIILRVLSALESGAEAAVPAIEPRNTIRSAEKTLDRSSLYEVQTPQGFTKDVLDRAYKRAAEDGIAGTDDASLVERLGAAISIVEGDDANIKITTPDDIPFEIRMGIGYDLHRLKEGRKLMLGCVKIPCEKGLDGRSDADVICHALADAALGAAGLGDIGRHFPDSDPAFEGMSGTEILRRTSSLLASAGFTIVNADVTLIAEKPKIAPYAEEMRTRMAEALGMDREALNIKATSEEGLGPTGEGLAMAALASVSLRY